MTLAAGTPGWAVADQSTCSPDAAGPAVCTAPPDNVQDWTDFITALMQHYNGKTQPHIRYYELWNEFNIALWWTGTDAQMLALAQAAYPIIHQDPYSVLLTPSVAGPVGTVAGEQRGDPDDPVPAGGRSAVCRRRRVPRLPRRPEQREPVSDARGRCDDRLQALRQLLWLDHHQRNADARGLRPERARGKPMFQTEGSWGNDTVTDPRHAGGVARPLHAAAGRVALDAESADGGTGSPGRGPTFGWGHDRDCIAPAPTGAGLAYTRCITGSSARRCARRARRRRRNVDVHA